MKKIISLTLAIMLVLSLSVPALAAGEKTITKDTAEQKGTTTLTVTTDENDITYTVTIPADSNVEYGKKSHNVGQVVLTAATLKVGSKVNVAVANSAFKLTDADDIPFTVTKAGTETAVTNIELAEVDDAQDLDITIAESSWQNAKVGEYQGTITFTCSVVE